MPVGLSLLLVLFFLLMNAFFVMAEFSLVRVRKSQVDMLVEEGRPGSKYAQLIANNVNAYLSACQLGITLASLALGWLGEPAVSTLFHPLFTLLGVPDSGIPSAMGFAFESGIPYSDGIVKNRYVGRTFIQPTQAMRQLGIRLKLNPLPSVIRGKRLVVIDDSIVRGNTSKKLIEMLRDAGATEVHMRIVSPEVMWPCFYGIDTDTRDQLIAANMTNDEMCEWMGADSLAFISLQGLRDSLPDVRTPGYCEACFSGEYPVDIPAYTARNSFMTKADFAAAYEKEAQEAENTQVSV